MVTEAEKFAYLQRKLALEESSAAQKKKEDEAASGPMGILSSVLGMGSAIGGMIPSLVKGGRQKRELQKFQRGQGAGASLARQTASEAARRVVGASTATPRGGRGGNLTEGLRAAEGIVQRGAQQAAVTGSKEALAATEMLRSNDLLRQNAFKTLGAGVGQGLAGIGGMLAASRDQGPVQGEAITPAQEADLQQQGIVTQTPQEMQQAKQQADVSATIRGGQEGLQRLQALQGQGPPAPGGTDRFTTPGSFTKEMQAAQAGGAAPLLTSPEEAAVQQQQAANLQEIGRLEVEKKDAARLAANSGGSSRGKSFDSSNPPPATDQAQLEEWIYNEVYNYSPGPVFFQGMAPEEAVKLLLEFGLPIDYARLGLDVPMSEQPQQAAKPYEDPNAALNRKATSGAFAAGQKIRKMFTGGS